MAIQLVIEAVPNQSFTSQLEDIQYSLGFREVGGTMAFSLSIADVEVFQNMRVLPDTPLIPFEHLEADGGNFVVRSEVDEIVGIVREAMFETAKAFPS